MYLACAICERDLISRILRYLYREPYWTRLQRYNDEISLEDAIHTALLTLKEGFEGQMTEKTIEIGVVTVPSTAELEAGKVEGTGRYKPTFRKLTEEEVRDYLAL